MFTEVMCIMCLEEIEDSRASVDLDHSESAQDDSVGLVVPKVPRHY